MIVMSVGRMMGGSDSGCKRAADVGAFRSPRCLLVHPQSPRPPAEQSRPEEVGVRKDKLGSTYRISTREPSHRWYSKLELSMTTVIHK